MKLCTKVIATTWQWPATAQASTLAVGACLNAMLFKFVMNENCKAVHRKRKCLAGTKLSMDEDFTPAQQACKLELWPLFKEAKAVGKHVWNMHGGGVNKLKMGVQILEMFQGANLILLIET
jgi:hypothetical protein